MRVLALRADSGGCAFYRVQEPARVVADQFDVDVRVDTNIEIEGTQDPRTGLITVSEVKEDVDLIVIQRPLDNAYVSLIQQAQRQGIACIVEVDDHFGAIHTKNIAYAAVNPAVHKTKNSDWMRKSAEVADLVTVSTPALATYYARHGRVEVLRNQVPESIFNIPTDEHEKPVLGWTGTVQTHPTDLQASRGAIGNVLALTQNDVYVVGDKSGVKESLGLPDSVNVHESGWLPLKSYYYSVGRNIDVGVVPLEDSPFNKAKSYLKGLEFAALGIPFVASDLPEYRLLAAHGIGETAKSPSDWRRYLSRWLSDSDRAARVGQTYRDRVRDSFTYEKNAHLWFNAWTRAVESRKAQL